MQSQMLGVLRLTCLPLDTNNEGNLSVDGILSQETRSLGVGAGQTDLGVDVEWKCLATRRPDSGGEWDIVGDQVIARHWAIECGGGGSLSLGSREVVGSRLDPCDTGIETGVTTEVRAEDAVLESRWVLEVDVQLAVDSALGDGDSRADGCNEGVKDESECQAII